MASDAPAAERPEHTVRPERAIVVGGGMAGLIVARDLILGGIPVTLIEAGPTLGGQVAPMTVGGIETDAAAESFATRGGVVAALATQLGLGDDIVTPRDSPAWLYRVDGSAVPLPATSVLGIPGVPMAADVMSVIGTRAALRAELDSLLPGQVGARSATLGELVRRRMGAGVLEGLVAPVVRGVHSAHPDDVALDRAVPGLRAALRSEGSLARAVRTLRERAPAGSQVAGIRGGVYRLAEVLTADMRRFGVDVRLDTPVTAVAPGRVTLAGGEVLEGRVVVAAASLAGGPAGAGGPAVSGAATADDRRITLVTLVVDAPELDAAPRGTGLLVAAGAPGVAARALTHATAKWEWLAERAGGLHVLRLSYDETPTDAAAQARRDAEQLTGARIAKVVDARVHEWTRATPRAHALDGMEFVGEAGTATGLAAVVVEAREASARILGVD